MTAMKRKTRMMTMRKRRKRIRNKRWSWFEEKEQYLIQSLSNSIKISKITETEILSRSLWSRICTQFEQTCCAQ